ncbi:histidine phosphatase family protein [Paenibacillus albus]|uniref:Histidine phosphatase family protein n=1 Tax=Paenibacillus albus TaxID=2495582 RepID=A0A3S9ABK6_9BACL|nr:histidine phosphatase family protein [Paenibacillus albus]AZN43094.1 histidine phosphatase family protein [Paenibacillus albus]
MRILLIRHADPDYPNDTITAAGHLEAEALADYLQHAGVDRIYSSPINRAVHTMKYTADRLGIEPMYEPWTRELNWPTLDEEGNAIAGWDIPGEKVRGERPYPDHGIWPERQPYKDYAHLYETIKADSDEFLQRLGFEREDGRYRIVTPSEETIAVFCHMGFGLTWLSHLLELPFPLVWSSFWLPPSSITTILFEERSKSWAVPRCLGLGQVTHLDRKGLPVSPMGLKANLK